MADEIKTKFLSEESRELGRRTALVTGSVALGALVTSSIFRTLRQFKSAGPQQLDAAIDAETTAMEFMEGHARFYQRKGSGVPIVLLHSISVAASSYEMKPIFEHLVASTTRPVFALDWLGFGGSDRPPVHYSPELYQRQLRRFLSEHVHQRADIVALSLACEYCAELARSHPYLVRNLVFISPTGVSNDYGISAWQRALVSVAGSVGAFEIFFNRHTRAEMLRKFYRNRVFLDGRVPADLVDYARKTALVYGAHHAPRHLSQGRLTNGRSAFRAYTQLRAPTLVVAPTSDTGLIQHFDHVDDLKSRNPEFIRIARVDAGLMPQWERPDDLFPAVDDYICSD